MRGGALTNSPSESAEQRWRDTLAELDYAERHGATPDEMERLAAEVIEARVAMFQAEVNSGWQLPELMRTALARDRELLRLEAEPIEPGTPR